MRLPSLFSPGRGHTSCHHDTRLTVVHWIIIALSLTLTSAAWWASMNAHRARAEQRFDSEADLVVDQFTDRLRRYSDVLRGVVATVSARRGTMTVPAWRRYTASLDVLEEFPATSGLALVEHIASEALPTFLAEQREQYPHYELHPPSRRAFHLPVTLVAPSRLETRLPGRDLAADRTRREALLRAAFLDDIQITAPIEPSGDGEPGFLMAAPFYDKGETPAWNDRHIRFAGAVVASVMSKDLAEEVMPSGRRLVQVAIRDGDREIVPNIHGALANSDPQPLFTREQTVSNYGREWTFELRTTRAFRDAVYSSGPVAVLVGGLIIDTMLVLLLLSVTRGRRQAVAYAERATEQLRIRTTALERANEDLDSFAHVVSHDLKTPLNGILHLTDHLDDDIDDTIDQPDVRAGLKRHLTRIRQQVERSHVMIEGILDYSGVGDRKETLRDVDVRTLVDEIGETLQLAPGELVLTGEVPILHTAATRLQQVLTNLIGNAFKYHHDRPNARVIVSMRRRDRFHEFRVVDNGPGIDPRFHERIFQVFETLQPRDLVASSGVGLSIVKKSVELYGGRVSLESTPGDGTAFLFEWPHEIAPRHDDLAHEPQARAA